ncbi:GNAT family N-acetyltransferase [Aestuariivivens sediminis]|uniref:GNAT family N-acetyltransferase n=1 Tax=Aestuariivivens sediminis TaxID=2913557 RepID=UPI001F5ABB8F|nr:GNAT family N-acetyltransferase [Aestuariivivens sediminis]
MKLLLDSCYIGPIQNLDANNLCAFVVANKDRLKRYFPITLKENLTPDLSKLFVEQKRKAFQLKEEFLYTIKVLKTSQLIGLIYLKAINWTDKHGELAYCIDRKFEGRGITTTVVNALCDYAFNSLRLKTLKIIVHKTNFASIKIAKKCNFTWIKTLKNEHTPPGESALDMELYELYKVLE